jgi:HEAT repeat protein
MKNDIKADLVSIFENRNESGWRRAHAATVLGNLKMPEAVEALNKCLLNEKNDYVCYRAAISAVELRSDSSIKPLVSFFEQENRSSLNNFVWALGEEGKENTIGFLQKLKEYGNVEVQQFAERTIDFIKKRLEQQFPG